MDGPKMRDLVMYWQQVELDEEAAKRLANQGDAICRWRFHVRYRTGSLRSGADSDVGP